MKPPRQHFRILGRGRGGGCARGFTLAEALLVLVNLGLAVALVFAGMGRIREQQRSELFITDLREISAVFQTYRTKYRAWPPAANEETALPNALQNDLVENTHWDGGSPFGGNYGWDGRGGIVLTAYSPASPLTATRDDWREIDRRIDDGNLATGRFRTGFNGWPVYQVEEKP